MVFIGERSLTEGDSRLNCQTLAVRYKLPNQELVFWQTVHALRASLMLAEVGRPYHTSEDSKENDTRAVWWWYLNVLYFLMESLVSGDRKCLTR
jgi:hypothetical protein